MVLSIIAFLLFTAYALLILFYYRGWKGLKNYQPASDRPLTKVSLIIPARNEAQNLPVLFKALKAQSYPSFLLEIIVVDDFSTDSTYEIANRSALSNLKVIRPQGSTETSSKKKAVAAGIALATGELIVTTDADCIPGPDWISILSSFYEKTNAAFIAAPVHYTYDRSLMQVFQSLDFMILQGITAASVATGFHSMCNGANLAYRRTAFFEVDGFEGIDHIASGDDLLLMHKIRTKYPMQIFYLKNEKAIVSTSPVKTLKGFLSQRKRWASKTFVYKDKRIFGALALVYLFNVLFAILLIAGFFDPSYWLLMIGQILLKTLVEYPFVSSVARFYNDSSLMKYFLFFQPFHITYTILVGFISQLGSYEWKGRKTK